MAARIFGRFYYFSGEIISLNDVFAQEPLVPARSTGLKPALLKLALLQRDSVTPLLPS
jgi:hypothetical protein